MPSEQILQNRYEILQILRNGVMETVYLGIDRQNNEKVVIKEFSSIGFDNPDAEIFREAFIDECQLLAGISHSGIAGAIDFFEAFGKDYFVMEFVSGSDLDKTISRRAGQFDLNSVLHWFGQMLDIVEYLHGLVQPVFHRDLKLSNFKLTADGKIKLLNFGIAGATLNSSNHTAEKSLKKAAFEIALPEQLIEASSQFENSFWSLSESETLESLNTKTSASTDIFALGTTLYQLLTNSLPPDARARAFAVWSGKLDPILPLSFLDQNIPAVIENAVLQSLSVAPSERPRSVKELRELLKGNNSVVSLLAPAIREVSPVVKSVESKHQISKKRTSRTFFQIYQKRFEKTPVSEKKSENLKNTSFNVPALRAF